MLAYPPLADDSGCAPPLAGCTYTALAPTPLPTVTVFALSLRLRLYIFTFYCCTLYIVLYAFCACTGLLALLPPPHGCCSGRGAPSMLLAAGFLRATAAAVAVLRTLRGCVNKISRAAQWTEGAYTILMYYYGMASSAAHLARRLRATSSLR